jgi:arylformamidase
MNLLSHFITRDTPSYGNLSPVSIEPASCMDHGATSNSLRFTLSNHVGTHIDLPLHFDATGKNLNDYEAKDWYFKNIALVDAALGPGELLCIEHLEGRVPPLTEVLLVRSGFEARRGQREYTHHNPGVSAETCAWLRESFPQLRVLGFDFISLSSFQNREIGRVAHRILLGHGIGLPVRIVEDMRLAHLRETPRNLLISPLLIERADATQVTVWADIP